MPSPWTMTLDADEWELLVGLYQATPNLSPKFQRAVSSLQVQMAALEAQEQREAVERLKSEGGG